MENAINKIGIINDLHLPYEHGVALNEALSILKAEDPDMIVVNGDLLDFASISKYPQVPDRDKLTVREQLQLGEDFFKELRSRHQRAIIKYVEGNHEFRFRTYPLRLAPELYDYVDLARDMHLKEMGVEWVGTHPEAAKWKDTFFDIDGVKIGHFDRVCKGAGMTVRNLMRDKGNPCIVQGHIHRGAIVYFTDMNGKTTWGMEVPCLCKDPTYASMTDWQRGLGFLYRDEWNQWRPNLIVF